MRGKSYRQIETVTRQHNEPYWPLVLSAINKWFGSDMLTHASEFVGKEDDFKIPRREVITNE